MTLDQWFQCEPCDTATERSHPSVSQEKPAEPWGARVTITVPGNVGSAATEFGRHITYLVNGEEFWLARDEFIEASLHLVYQGLISGRVTPEALLAVLR